MLVKKPFGAAAAAADDEMATDESSSIILSPLCVDDEGTILPPCACLEPAAVAFPLPPEPRFPAMLLCLCRLSRLLLSDTAPNTRNRSRKRE